MVHYLHVQYVFWLKINFDCNKLYNTNKYIDHRPPIIWLVINPLAYTDVCEMAGLARSINTQPAVRRNSETNPISHHNRGMYWSQ